MLKLNSLPNPPQFRGRGGFLLRNWGGLEREFSLGVT